MLTRFWRIFFQQNLSCLIVGLVTLGLLAIVGGLMGLTWDESTYFLYVEALAKAIGNGSVLTAIHSDPYLSYWINPHPAIQKWSDLLIAPHLEGVFGYLAAYRFPWQIWVAMETGLAFHLVRNRFGHRGAMLLLLLLLGMPRFIAYCSLGIQDGLVALSWLNLALISRDLHSNSSWRTWALFCSVGFIAAGAKITGWMGFIPVGLLLLTRKDWLGVAKVAGASIGAACFAAWITPNFWTNEFYRAPLAYLLYPTLRGQVPIATFYEGRQFLPHAPWHWGPEIIFATTPPLHFFALLLGLAAPLFHHRSRWLAPFGLFWLLVIFLPNSPRHDDIRQFLSFLPLALLSGVLAIDLVISSSRRPKLLGLLACVLLGLGGIHAWLSSLSFPLSYYSPFVGNLEGAEKRGFDVTLYFEALGPDMLRFINDQLPPNARLAQLPQWSFPLILLQRHGLLRKDIRVMDYISPSEHDAVLVYRRRAVVSDSSYFSGTAMAEIRFRHVSMIRLVQLSKFPNSPSARIKSTETEFHSISSDP